MKLDELKTILKTRKISQRALAGMIGMNRSTLAAKMSGRCPFNVDEAQKISEAIHLSNDMRRYIFLT